MKRSVNYKTRKIKLFIDESEEEQKGEKCEKVCEKCKFNVALFYQIQIRSADEPMTTFFKCLKCKNITKEQ